jgi:hypothetical protein
MLAVLGDAKRRARCIAFVSGMRKAENLDLLAAHAERRPRALDHPRPRVAS